MAEVMRRMRSEQVDKGKDKGTVEGGEGGGEGKASGKASELEENVPAASCLLTLPHVPLSASAATIRWIMVHLRGPL
jgi:hypothetical protein